MFPLMARYENGGLSKADFCREHGLNLAVFWYWYGKYRQRVKKEEVKFIKVENLPISGIKMELVCGGTKMIFYEFPPASYLREVITTR